MRVRDLGPVSVEDETGDHPCVGKQAALLALLALHVGERVPADALAAAGWGLTTAVSSSTVENHMWRLRRLLEPRRPRGAPSVLVNVAGGYRLDLPGAAVDSREFESLAGRSAAALDQGDAALTLRTCDAALARWRGAPYEALGHLTSVAAATNRLEELRGQVLERRVEALLRLGRADEALTELGSLVERHPYREHLWARRITTLASRGRTEEALTAYRTVRRILLQDLGIEPGEQLRRAHAEALTGSAPTSAPGRVPVPIRARRRGRPAGPGVRRRDALVGREHDVAAVTGLLDEHLLVTVAGAGGCGKTRLAVEVAAAVEQGFEDGVWFADLTAVTEPGQVLDVVVSTLGLVLAGREALEAVVDHVAASRLLLVLDNCEHVVTGAAELVDAVLDALSGPSGDHPDLRSRSRVLATSREPLEVPGEVVRRLAPLEVRDDDAATPSDDRPAPSGSSPAATLFAARMGRAPASPEEGRDVERICRAVDGLPLAIELAAARTRSFSVREVLDQVTEDPGRLSRLGGSGPGHQGTLESALDWSYRLLPAREQAVHRRLAVLPGPFTLPVATAVAAATDVEVHDVPAALAHLEHRSLLVASPTGSGRTVFRQLDTVRAHARHRLEDAGELAAATGRRDEWVALLIAGRPRLGDPAEVAWHDALDDGWPSVRATLTPDGTRPEEEALALLGGAAGLNFYAYHRVRVIEVRRLLEGWLTDGVGARPELRAHPSVLAARLTYAAYNLLSGRGDFATAVVADVLPLLADLDEEWLVPVGEALVATGDSAWSANDFVLVGSVSPALRALADRSGDTALQLLATKVEVEAGLITRTPAATAALAEELYASGLATGNLLVQWSACGMRAIAGVLSEDPDAVTLWTDRLIAGPPPAGSGWRWGLPRAARERGDPRRPGGGGRAPVRGLAVRGPSRGHAVAGADRLRRAARAGAPRPRRRGRPSAVGGRQHPDAGRRRATTGAAQPLRRVR